MRTITVNIYAADIFRGVPGHPSKSPIARALRRHPELADAEIRSHQIVTSKYAISLPRKINAFVDAFDNGNKVKPCTFRLEIPK